MSEHTPIHQPDKSAQPSSRAPHVDSQPALAPQSLQRAIGNAAVGRLLQRRTAPPPSDGGAPPPVARTELSRRTLDSIIQRLAWDDAPLDITPTPNRTARKSAGGAAAGVYFVSEAGQTVVLKFLEPDEALKSQVGNRVMAAGVGPDVATPDSRIITPGSQESNDIKAAIQQYSTLDLPGTAPALMRLVDARLKAEAAQDTTPGKVIMSMSPVQQTSLREMAQAPAQHPQLIAVLTRASVVEGFAKIIVADAVLGNSDRFMKDVMPANPVVDVPANISNVFVNPAFTAAVALDNETDRSMALTDAEKQNNPGQIMERRNYLSNALMNPTIGQQLAESIVCACLMDAGELGPGPITPGRSLINVGQHPPLPLTEAMAAGNVVATLGAMMTAALTRQIPLVLGSMRTNRGAMRGDFQAAEQGSGLAVTRTTTSYDMLRGRAKYLKALNDGKNQAQAAQRALDQITHKEAKAARQQAHQQRMEEAGRVVGNAGEIVKGGARIAANKFKGLFG